MWLPRDAHALELSFLLVAGVRTAQGKTAFVGENTLLSKLGQGERLKDVCTSHEMVAPERGVKISRWRKARLWWTFKTLIRGGNQDRIKQCALWGRGSCQEQIVCTVQWPFARCH